MNRLSTDLLRYLLSFATTAPLRFVCRRWRDVAPASKLRFRYFCKRYITMLWALENGYKWTNSSAGVIASMSSLSILKLARAEGCPWGLTFMGAGAEAKIDILEWALEEGCPNSSHVIYVALRTGNTITLDWAWAHLPQEVWKAFPVYAYATEYCHVSVLEWLGNHGYRFGETQLTWVLNSKRRSPDSMEWGIHKSGLTEGQKTKAAKIILGSGDVGAAKVLLDTGYPMGENIKYACLSGSKDLLLLLHNRGIRFNESSCAAAAVGGHLEALQWLRSIGCPWNTGTTMAALDGGHQHVYDWAVANGCPCSLIAS